MPSRPKQPSAALELIPEQPTLPALRAAAAACTACHLHTVGTQTVFGEGPEDAELMLVGEQPGDQEDKAGRPFVGPAGGVLDRALEAAGLDRERVYVSNAVKHFKWVRRGKVRLHQKPNAEEVRACRPWLDAELALVSPRVLVCLGATAAQALLGSSFRVTAHRGQWVDSPLAPKVTATVHPSSILRAPDEEARQLAFKGLVADLTVVAEELGARA